MKRTGFKRKTFEPGEPFKKIKKIKQVSDKRAKMDRAYHADVKERRSEGEGDVCEKCLKQGATDPHHTHGRRTITTILTYIFVCRNCHDWIHANEKEALTKGFLDKEFFISTK